MTLVDVETGQVPPLALAKRIQRSPLGFSKVNRMLQDFCMNNTARVPWRSRHDSALFSELQITTSCIPVQQADDESDKRIAIAQAVEPYASGCARVTKDAV